MEDMTVIKYIYPDGTHCYRALHTTQAVYRSEDGKLIARAIRAGSADPYEFEIVGFELLEAGIRYS
jgi:hypothetical protein